MTVKIYTTPTCVYCKLAKQFFGQHNVQYEEVDVTRNEAALNDMVKKTGQMGVPVIEVDGHMVVGFDKAKLSELLKIGREA